VLHGGEGKPGFSGVGADIAVGGNMGSRAGYFLMGLLVAAVIGFLALAVLHGDLLETFTHFSGR
jgi:hypothetical protein